MALSGVHSSAVAADVTRLLVFVTVNQTPGNIAIQVEYAGTPTQP